MSLADCASFTIGGGWDIFDRARSVADCIEELASEHPIELHPATELTDMHFYDPDEVRRSRLKMAKQMLDEVELILQQEMEAA